MDDEFKKRVETKLDKVTDDINDIKVVLAKQNEQLEYHIKRTNLAEENMQMLRADFKPVKDHVIFMQNIFSLVAKLAVVLAAVVSIIKVFFL